MKISRKTLKNLYEKMLRILWPEVCPFCGRASEQGICDACQTATDNLLVQEPRCMKCGRPMGDYESEYCRECMKMEPAYDRGISLWLHVHPVSNSIYHFKFHNQRFFARYYGKMAARKYAALFLEWNPDFIFPIPLHKSRMKKRGFNQAYLLARELARETHKIYPEFCPMVTDQFLLRVKRTKPQKQLDHDQRKENIQGAFSCGKLYGESIMLVDDIFTTGSTIEAAAEELKKQGAGEVYFFTLSTASLGS